MKEEDIRKYVETMEGLERAEERPELTAEELDRIRAAFEEEMRKGQYGKIYVAPQPVITQTLSTLPVLSKREYVASLLMQGMLAGKLGSLDFEGLSGDAVRAADALIKELEKGV